MDAGKTLKIFAILIVDVLLVNFAGKTREWKEPEPVHQAKATSILFHEDENGEQREHEFCKSYFGVEEGKDAYFCTVCGFTIEAESHEETGLEKVKKEISEIIDRKEEEKAAREKEAEENPSLLGVLVDILLDKSKK